jgi:hypothetical protein
LPYKVKPNDHSYDTAMELDFMAVWWMIKQDITRGYWIALNDAFNQHAMNPDLGLPPISEWTDNPNSDSKIAVRLIQWEEYGLDLLNTANKTQRNWRFVLQSDDSRHEDVVSFPTFSTYQSDTANGISYANSRYSIKKLIEDTMTSDAFSSMYSYSQDVYYSSTSLTIFWTCFAILLLGTAALVYARTDIK